MAKAKNAKKAAAAATVTVKDLEQEFGLPGKVIRQVIRTKVGLRAPAIEQEGFGPRAKYEWEEGSKELAKVRAALEEHLNAMQVKRAAEAAEANEDDEAEDEEYEEEEEDEED